MKTKNNTPEYGRVYIAGFGPGNPELLTTKTRNLLDIVDIIYHDDLLDTEFLKQFAAEKIYVGKRKGQHSTRQEDINELLLKSAKEGKSVLRLKGGDPLIFGRGSEEYYFLKEHGVESEIIPGISSSQAAAADAIAPLTSRGTSTSVAFTLGHDAINNKLPKADTLVFYMGASNQKKWADRLINEGWPENTPVATVRNASLPDKEIKRYTLGELVNAEKTLPAPSIVIVGLTASINAKAHNQKWLYTGSDFNNFKGEGLVVHNPMISFNLIENNINANVTIDNISSYSRILFPTPISVKFFFELLYSKGKDARVLSNIEISSMGKSTSKELKKYGLIVVPETDKNSSAELINKFTQEGIKNENILIPCSSEGLEIIPTGLRNIGNKVDDIAFYESNLPKTAVRHNLNDFHGVVFTSPTTVKNFFKFYEKIPSGLEIKVKGKYTQELFDKLNAKI